MAGGFSIYMANNILNKSLKGTDYVLPTTLYVALSTTASTVDMRANLIGSSSECANSGGYARMPIALAEWSTATAGFSSITVDVIFPTATGSWGTCQQAMIMDTSTPGSGNILAYGPLSSTTAMQNGDVLRIPANSVVITV